MKPFVFFIFALSVQAWAGATTGACDDVQSRVRAILERTQARPNLEVIADARLRQETEKLLSQNSTSARQIAADRLAGHAEFKGGVVQDRGLAALYKNVADEKARELERLYPVRDSAYRVRHNSEQTTREIRGATEFIVNPDKLVTGANVKAWEAYDRGARLIQDRYVEVARNYWRAGLEKEATQILMQSPAYENMSHLEGVDVSLYLNRTLESFRRGER